MIGLFPLHIVLFPGSSYPLNIFESRYKILIQEAMTSKTEFGINLVDAGRMFPVGCLAQVTEVLNTDEDGRMDIIVTGTNRYMVKAFYTDAAPYLTADTDAYEDENPRPEYSVLEGTISLYNQLIESVYGEAEDLLDPSDWLGGGASFRMAQKSGLDLTVRQQLLEMRSETERLEFINQYLSEILPKIKEVEKFQMLVRNDGYVKPGTTFGEMGEEPE